VDGEPVEPSGVGAHARLSKYDALNQLAEMWHVDAENNLTISADGYARKTNQYNALGNLVEVKYFDADDKPMMFRGAFRYVLIYDPKTNEQSELVGYDTEGNIVNP